MASEAHLCLSEQVKNVHLWLRTRSQEIGPHNAWAEHLQRKEVLKNYSTSMKELAKEHWSKINQGDKKSLCRIDWICRTASDYFYNGIFQKEVQKESARFGADVPDSTSLPSTYFSGEQHKLKLLDVGSCYDPFQEFDEFLTYAIDLCPAPSTNVRECDFLTVEVSQTLLSDNSWFRASPVTELPSDYFDLVVFSLFLEYLPCHELRLKACRQAWECLKPNGILLIVTPDSNHQSAHSSLMKEWNLALIRIGFVRFKLEKLKYLYCMAFRKTAQSLIQSYLELKRHRCDKEPLLQTPQDFVNYIKLPMDDKKEEDEKIK